MLGIAPKHFRSRLTTIRQLARIIIVGERLGDLPSIQNLMSLSHFAAVTVSYFTSVASRALLIFNTTPAFLSATSLT